MSIYILNGGTDWSADGVLGHYIWYYNGSNWVAVKAVWIWDGSAWRQGFSQPAPGPLNYITVTPSTATVPENSTQQFTARGYDSHDIEITGLTFTWSIDTFTDSIDSTGLFTAGSSPSNPTVSATSGGVVGTAHVTVP